MIRNLYN